MAEVIFIQSKSNRINHLIDNDVIDGRRKRNDNTNVLVWREPELISDNVNEILRRETMQVVVRQEDTGDDVMISLSVVTAPGLPQMSSWRHYNYKHAWCCYHLVNVIVYVSGINDQSMLGS